VGASTIAVENRGATAAGAREDARDIAALVNTGDQLATITAGTRTDSVSTASSTLCESSSAAARSIVGVLVRATVRRHTRVSYIRLDGSRDDESEGDTASLRAGAPELLLRSELSFVMSSSVLLPSPSHNYG